MAWVHMLNKLKNLKKKIKLFSLT